MYHSLLARCKLKECAKLFDADYASCKDLSCLKLGSDDLDHTFCFIHTLLVCSANRNCAVVCDVDLHTCTLDDRVDSLSSLSDYITDLLRVDLDLDDLRSKLPNSCTRLVDTFLHNFCQDIFSCLFCSADRFLNDWSCKTMDFDIHLDRCDSVMCSGYLEVHISEEVLKALDICKNDVIIVCFTCNKSAGNTCNRFSDRYTGSHQ